MRLTAGPYLQDVTPTSVTVMWHTDGPGAATVSFEWSGDMGFLGRVRGEPVTRAANWAHVQFVTPVLPEYVYWCRALLSALPDTTGTAWFDEIEVRGI